MSDTAYCYPPDYTVLKNKAGLRDPQALERFEHLNTLSRGLDCPVDLPISYAGYQAIHRHLFQDVYDWAGQSRTVNIHKGGMFAAAPFVDREMDRRFRQLYADNHLQGLNRRDFANQAAEHISEINAIHPFREGNGRTQRLFLRNLAHQAGHRLDIARIPREQWMAASVQGFRAQNYQPMAAVITHALEDRVRQHQERMKSASKDRGDRSR